MGRNLWATGLVAVLGAALLVRVCRWIVVSDNAPWLRYYPRSGRDVDQRWAIPIAAFVDLIYAAVGLSTGADTTFGISVAVVLGLQVLLITAVLAALRGRTNHVDR